MPEKKILVVDDVKIVFVAFRKELCKEGYEVECALSGEEALRKVKAKRYDLVFIDLVMPGMDGVKTCRAIKEISPETKLVFITGKIDKNLSERELQFAKAGGELYYLYKPFLEGEIVKTAKAALGG